MPAPIAYTRAIPYNVPPFAASISTFSRVPAAPAFLPAPLAAPAAPYLPAPAPFLPAPAPLAYAAPAPLAYAAPAPLLPAPAPFVPAAPAPFLPAPAVIPAARSIHAYAPAFRAALPAPLVAPFYKK